MNDVVVFYGRVKNPNMYVDAIWSRVKSSGDNIKLTFDLKTNKLIGTELLK